MKKNKLNFIILILLSISNQTVNSSEYSDQEMDFYVNSLNIENRKTGDYFSLFYESGNKNKYCTELLDSGMLLSDSDIIKHSSNKNKLNYEKHNLHFINNADCKQILNGIIEAKPLEITKGYFNIIDTNKVNKKYIKPEVNDDNMLDTGYNLIGEEDRSEYDYTKILNDIIEAKPLEITKDDFDINIIDTTKSKKQYVDIYLAVGIEKIDLKRDNHKKLEVINNLLKNEYNMYKGIYKNKTKFITSYFYRIVKSVLKGKIDTALPKTFSLLKNKLCITNDVLLFENEYYLYNILYKLSYLINNNVVSLYDLKNYLNVFFNSNEYSMIDKIIDIDNKNYNSALRSLLCAMQILTWLPEDNANINSLRKINVFINNIFFLNTVYAKKKEYIFFNDYTSLKQAIHECVLLNYTNIDNNIFSELDIMLNSLHTKSNNKDRFNINKFSYTDISILISNFLYFKKFVTIEETKCSIIEDITNYTKQDVETVKSVFEMTKNIMKQLQKKQMEMYQSQFNIL